MQVPMQITYRDVDHSTEVDAHIREKGEKLGQFSDKIISCSVVLEYVSKHQQTGNLFNTRINLSVPNKELVSTHSHDENMYVSIREAFADIERQLEDYTQMKQGKAKDGPVTLEGKVCRMYSDYGFIEALDGSEYYFNEESVAHPRFDALSIGQTVHFVADMGRQGPHAHRVSLQKKPSGNELS